MAALCNAAVAIYIYKLVPEFLLRFAAWVLTHTLYRLRAVNTDRIPAEGAAVIVDKVTKILEQKAAGNRLDTA